MLIGRGCNDADVRALASGEANAFAAWTVEGRTDTQLLVCDFVGLTRSWLMVGARLDGLSGTQLYFGSAVVPRARDKAGNPRPTAGFSVAAAGSRIVRQGAPAGRRVEGRAASLASVSWIARACRVQTRASVIAWDTAFT